MSTSKPKSDRTIDVGMGLLLLGACASGWIVAAGRVRPENLFDAALATETFLLHGDLGAVALFAALLLAVQGSRAASATHVERGARVLGLASIVLAVVLPVLRHAQFTRGALVVAGVLELIVGVLAVTVVVRRFHTDGWTPFTVGVGSAGLAAMSNGARMALLHTSSPSTAFELLAIASVAILCEPARDDVTARPRLLPFVALVALALVRSFVTVRDEYTQMVLSALLIPSGLFIGVTTARHAWRVMPSGLVSAHATRCGHIAVGLFATSVCLRAFLAPLSSDVRLQETTFVSGTLHMETFVVLLTGPALWLRDREPRQRATWVLGAGIISIGVGAHLTCWAMLVMGSQGMPMRYVRYLEQFTRLHRMVAVGATLVFVGLVVTLVSVVRRREPEADIGDVFA